VPDLFDMVAQPMGSIDLLTVQAGTRAQAPPVMRAERHRRRGSQATWPPTLPVPAVRPAGYGPCTESPLLICPSGWPPGLPHGVQLGLMGVQLGCTVIRAGLRGCG